jgi:hypothetical protein
MSLQKLLLRPVIALLPAAISSLDEFFNVQRFFHAKNLNR